MKQKIFRKVSRALSALAVAASIFVASAVTASATPPQSIINEVKEQVRNVQWQLPAQIGGGLELRKVEWQGGSNSIVYRYYYTGDYRKPSQSEINEMKAAIVHMIRADHSSDDYRFVSNGITFYYNYYSSSGQFLYAVKVTPSDLR